MYSIYKYTVIDTGKSYIGQTIKMPVARLRQHLTEAKYRPIEKRTKWHRAILKYGIERILITVIETHNNREEAGLAERRLIAAHNTIKNGYNTHEGGFGGHTRTSEQIEQLRQRMIQNNPMKSQESRNKVSESLKAYSQTPDFRDWRVQTQETRSEKMRGSKNWNFGKKMSDETKSKLSASLKKKASEISREDRACKVYLVTTPDGTTRTVLSQQGLYDFLASYGHKEWAFRAVIRGETVAHGPAVGWIIKTIAKEDFDGNIPSS